MFCPYLRKQYVRATVIHYNEESVEDKSVIYEKFENMDCKKEQCGVWHDGKCQYKCN